MEGIRSLTRSCSLGTSRFVIRITKREVPKLQDLVKDLIPSMMRYRVGGAGGGHTYGTPPRRTTASSASVVCPPPAIPMVRRLTNHQSPITNHQSYLILFINSQLDTSFLT